MPASKEITKAQAEMLAAVLHELRPRWSVPSLVKMIGDERTTADFPDLVWAAVNVALWRPEAETPAVIFMTGKHWLTPDQAASPAHTVTLGNDLSPDCEHHPGIKAWECRPCRKPTPPPANFRELIEQETLKARQARTVNQGEPTA